MVLGLQAWAPDAQVKAICAAELTGRHRISLDPACPCLASPVVKPFLPPELGLCWSQAFLDVGMGQDQAPSHLPGLPWMGTSL